MLVCDLVDDPNNETFAKKPKDGELSLTISLVAVMEYSHSAKL